ncbi:MAG: hypothetical protein H0U49_08200 [Parachlamydiaceae bacterium]|nr:hypothetical protein [Parachlamydiaceae bacterium]
MSSSENQITWQKQLSADECQKVKTYLKSEDKIGPLSATLKPVRTNNWDNFSKDFFLPTTVNHAIKVQHTVGRIFAILASLVLDIFTSPIRLLMTPYRVYSNANKEEHPLQKYLKAEGVDEKMFESGRAELRLQWETMSETPTSHWTTNDGVKHSSHSRQGHFEEKNINFIEVPYYELKLGRSAHGALAH